MEPTTAPQPDMAPELTPEEEQVSGAAAAAVGVSGHLRPSPAVLFAAGGPRWPPTPRPRRPRPRPSTPEAGGAAGRCSRSRPLLSAAYRSHIAPSPYSGDD